MIQRTSIVLKIFMVFLLVLAFVLFSFSQIPYARSGIPRYTVMMIRKCYLFIALIILHATLLLSCLSSRTRIWKVDHSEQVDINYKCQSFGCTVQCRIMWELCRSYIKPVIKILHLSLCRCSYSIHVYVATVEFSIK